MLSAVELLLLCSGASASQLGGSSRIPRLSSAFLVWGKTAISIPDPDFSEQNGCQKCPYSAPFSSQAPATREVSVHGSYCVRNQNKRQRK